MANIKSTSADRVTGKLLSPCISVCQMDPLAGICLGCYRTRGEIASWRSMDETDQLKLLDILSERRAAGTGAKRRRPRRQVERLVL